MPISSPLLSSHYQHPPSTPFPAFQLPHSTSTPHTRNRKAPTKMPSKANIYGHPIHPMLVAFPIVFFIMALVADVGYEAGWAGTDWPQFAYILLIGGIATALAAAIAGLIEYSIIVDEETKQKANGHMVLNMAVLVLQAVNLSYRGHAKSNHYWRHGWILSLVSVVLLTISGWLGQELVYKHRMGDTVRGAPLSTQRAGLVST